MNIAGLSPQSFQKVNQLLKEVGKAVDPKSPGQATITEAEAGKILEAYEKLNAGEKAVVAKTLQTFFQQDVFTVDEGARAAFAKALGVDAKSLEPQAPASASPIRSVMKAAMQALTRPVGVDKKSFDELKASLKDAPREIGDFLMSALKGASEDGNIKMDGEARREFTKEFAARNQDGAVSWLSNKFGDEFVKKMPPMALSMLSSPPFFEEIIAALMITLVNQTNEEVIREQMMIDSTLKADQKKTDTLKGAQKSEIQKDLQGQGDANGAGATGGPGKVEGAGPQGGGQVASTKGKLEAVVTSIDSRMKDGFISREDAVAIRGKLERFDKGDPVTKLLAEAMGTAMQHSGLLDNRVVAPRLEPISEWVKEVTGTTSFPKPEGISSDKPLARALMESDKLEQRLAGFLVEAFVDRPKTSARAATQSGASAPAADGAGPTPTQTARQTMEKFKPLLQQMLQQAAPAELEKGAPQTGTHAELLQRFSRIVDARDKLPPGTLEASIGKTVDRHAGGLEPAHRQTLKDGLKSAFDALPKTGKPSAEQVKAAFEKATAKAVDDVEKGMTPDELAAKAAIVGGGIDKALQSAAERIETIADQGKSVSPAEQKQILQDEIAKQRASVAAEAKANGYDADQQNGLLAAFDRQGARSVETFEKTGKIEPTSPSGAGKDTTDPAQTDDTRSRQLMFEKLKFKMNQLSEMMQAMSNILNTMHQNAENTIRAIR